MQETQEIVPIKDPYPVPPVSTVVIEKEEGQAVGMSYKTIEDGTTVVVSEIRPGGLMESTPIRVGHEILAVNGIAVRSCRQLKDIIVPNTKLEFTTLDHLLERQPSPFCYVGAAPTSSTNPGVSFGSCCNRTMVMISDIFLSDLTTTATRLNVGDIVLAVNGVPVWKPEQADRLQLVAGYASKAVVLYCVNMSQLRDYFVTRVQRLHKDTRTKLKREAIITKRAHDSYDISERYGVCKAKINCQTQMFEDVTDWNLRLKKPAGGIFASKKNLLMMKKSYETVCLPTLSGLNRLMRDQLNDLKLAIVGHAWDYEMRMKRDDEEPSVYAVPMTFPGSSVDLRTVSTVVVTPAQSPQERGGIPIADAVPIESCEMDS